MRGALEKLPGVAEAVVAPGNRDVRVRYDPAQTGVDQLLAGLAAAGEPARKK